MEGGSPDQESIGSGTRRSTVCGNRSRNCKEFLCKFVDFEGLTAELEDWFELRSSKKPSFDVPFELIDLQNLDHALEGISFQQLIRMPNSVHASTSDAVEATAFLAVEDFLQASVKGLWEAFWGQEKPMPFSVACLYKENLHFYETDTAIAYGKLGGLCGTGILLKNPRPHHRKWDHILELALRRPDIGTLAIDNDGQPSLSVLGEALFYAIHLLLSRSLSRLNFYQTSNSVYIILVDSQYGGVVKVEGDVNKLEFNLNNVYECAAEWIKKHCRIAVSPIDRIWNKLGNINWRDIGALQVLFATFHSITQFAGFPEHSVEDLAAGNGSHLQIRTERQLGETRVNGNGLFRFQQLSVSPEIVEVLDDIVEVQDEFVEIETEEIVEAQDESVQIETEELMKLEVGSVLWLQDSNWQKGYQINEVYSTGEHPCVASPVAEPEKNVFLYVGSHRSQLEPAGECMKLWYQVQRQTKILSHETERIIHPGQCHRSGSGGNCDDSRYGFLTISGGNCDDSRCCSPPSSGGNCDHPWCGTPILVTSPVGETVNNMVSGGRFSSNEAIRCCHDCLSALTTAASAGIRHGDIRPQNVICVRSGARHPYFVLIGWVHAVLEERDCPPMNLHFSSTFALQEGKLSSASDAESLVYMLYFCCGGELPNLDSVEEALQWRETIWSRGLIQQKLGDVSTVLKAFAYDVDSLCGTPYPMDYAIWLRRLKTNVQGEDYGEEIDTSG